MSACSEIRLLLGPFEDGELEPHEMADVALHVVVCPACKAELQSYRAIGLALRDVAQPSIDGFAAAVLARIEHVPLRLRLIRYFDSMAARFGAAVAIGAAGAFAAVITVFAVTPYARQLTNHSSPVQVASVHQQASIAQLPASFSIATPVAAQTHLASDRVARLARQTNVPGLAQGSSSTETWPMFAVSNDPQTDTTVIWVAGQQ